MKLSPTIAFLALAAPLTLAAQTLPITFEDDVTTANFVDFEGGVAVVVANPLKSDANPSDSVARMVRDGGAVFAGSKIVLDGPLDFSEAGVLQLQVLTDAPVGTNVTFKIEGGGAGLERPSATTVSGTWETLAFDFGGVANTFSEVTFLFDLGNVGDGSAASTFFFDDVAQVSTGPKGARVDLPVTFDEEGVDYTLTDFEGSETAIVEDPTTPGNTVARFTRPAGAGFAAGTTIGTGSGFATPVPLSRENSAMSARVWSPRAGVPVRFKIETATDPTRSVETEVLTTVAEQFETLVFDFATEVPGTTPLAQGLDAGYVYNEASIFFDFGRTTGPEEVFYFDDVRFEGTSAVTELATGTLQVFPNPAVDRWIIESAGPAVRAVTVLDASGRVVWTHAAQDALRVTIPADGLAAGVYSANVETEAGRGVVELLRG